MGSAPGSLTVEPVTRSEGELDPFLRLRGVTKSYDGDTLAVDHLNLTAAEGELVALLGPSGCGKTTTLRIIAGFISHDAGEIYVQNERVDHLRASMRGAGMVFQDYALFPHMTVADNIAFGLRMHHVPRARRMKQVQDMLALVELWDQGDKYPRELSGGMQQRVALARALVLEPRMLLLDEPLSNLDANLRKQMRKTIRDLQAKVGITTVFVTHDIEEAFSLASRVAVMNGGRVEQYEKPETMYGSPASAFVARFVGHVNVFEGEFRPGSGGTAVFRCAGFEVVTNSEVHEAIDGAYSIPPFAIQLSDSLDRPHADNVLPGVVMTTAYVGGSYSVLVQSGNAMFECAVPSRGEVADVPREGTDVWLCWGKREGYAVTN